MSPAQPVHALAAGLWRELASEPGNIAASPYSVAVALGMTATGARGRTLEEMLALLDVSDVGSLNAALAEIARHVDAQPDVEFRSASRLFGQRGTVWETDFLAALSDYSAGMGSVDFANSVEEARSAINGWTAERTRGRIAELLPPGMLSELSRLVLVNALYLKAAWADQFERRQTTLGAFHLEDGSRVDVPIMRSAAPTEHAVGDGWGAVRMPYVGRAVAMTVVLPDPGRLAEVEHLVAAGGLPDIMASLRHQQVDLALPRWTIRTGAELQGMLARLGMPTAFSASADFGGMTLTEEISISAVVHQVFVAIDEDGTEAAAATAVAARAAGMPPTPIPMVVDRPFLFVIHDVRHGSPLFLGRVADPRGSGS